MIESELGTLATYITDTAEQEAVVNHQAQLSILNCNESNELYVPAVFQI